MGRKKELKERESFFKILIGDFVNQLRIPPDFVKRFHGVFPRKCKICRPGKRWIVGVIKDGNAFFLGDGWSEFVHDNALELGELLVFKHKGNSKFSVRIYGKNACEKGSVFPAIRKERKNQCRSSGQKKLELAVANNTMSIKDIKQENEDDTFRDEGKIVTALEAFDKYAYHKTYFKFQLRPKHMKDKCLHLPLDIIGKMMVKESGQNVMLQVADKLWHVKVLLYPNTSGRIYAGWADFMKDNNLQVGDVCLFELSERNNMVINVSIYEPTS